MRYITKKRASGILLHVTSLPSKYGIGDFGQEAYRFVDFLARAKQSCWQVLPFAPPARNSYSPYNCLSAFAGNTLFISPDLLYHQGLLTKRDIQDSPTFPKTRVEYRKVITYKTKLLNAVYEHFKGMRRTQDYEQFCLENRKWLDNFAVFAALRQYFYPRLWCNWPTELRDGKKCALKSIKVHLQDSINREKFLQYIFFKQWFSLKQYSNQKGIKIIGDIPIYVAYDSADVWANPRVFELTRTKRPRFVAGVPPDLFSRTGQLWGNPTYDWHALKKTQYSWWIQRIKHNLKLFDIVRIDHFRGFFAYWRVPASCKTAVKGKWTKGPGEKFFNTLFQYFPSESIIVEDLGYITSDIKAFIEKSQLTGMKVLLFAFRGNPAENPHCIQNHRKNSVVYTGTHDNNTIKGWFEKEADAEQRKKLFDYLGYNVTSRQIHWELIKLAMSSIANLIIIPVQDILGLGEDARMNHPATIRGNWRWRLCLRQITPQVVRKLARLTETFGRA